MYCCKIQYILNKFSGTNKKLRIAQHVLTESFFIKDVLTLSEQKQDWKEIEEKREKRDIREEKIMKTLARFLKKSEVETAVM